MNAVLDLEVTLGNIGGRVGKGRRKVREPTAQCDHKQVTTVKHWGSILLGLLGEQVEYFLELFH